MAALLQRQAMQPGDFNQAHVHTYIHHTLKSAAFYYVYVMYVREYVYVWMYVCVCTSV